MSQMSGMRIRFLIAPSAAASSALGTVTRTSSQPASSSAWIWATTSSTRWVSGTVIDWTTTGLSPPTGTPPTGTTRVLWRGRRIALQSAWSLAVSTRVVMVKAVLVGRRYLPVGTPHRSFAGQTASRRPGPAESRPPPGQPSGRGPVNSREGPCPVGPPAHKNPLAKDRSAFALDSGLFNPQRPKREGVAMQVFTRERVRRWLPRAAVCAVLLCLGSPALLRSEKPRGDQDKKSPPPSSYDQVSPVLLGQETFQKMMADDKAGKAAVMARQQKLLEERYDLAVKVDDHVKMSRGKPIPVGPAAKLSAGTTWEKLAEMSPDEIKEKGLFPKGFLPLPHPHHEVGG